MHPLTTTATPTPTSGSPAIGFLILIAVLVTLGYGLSCWLWPFTLCRKCCGSGLRRGLFFGGLGACRLCDGTGRSLRIGRRLIDSLRELHRKGTK